jgi:hypothetical protein
VQTVLDVMRNCDSLDARQVAMNAVSKASAVVSNTHDSQPPAHVHQLLK